MHCRSRADPGRLGLGCSSCAIAAGVWGCHGRASLPRRWPLTLPPTIRSPGRWGRTISVIDAPVAAPAGRRAYTQHRHHRNGRGNPLRRRLATPVTTNRAAASPPVRAPPPAWHTPAAACAAAAACRSNVRQPQAALPSGNECQIMDEQTAANLAGKAGPSAVNSGGGRSMCHRMRQPGSRRCRWLRPLPCRMAPPAGLLAKYVRSARGMPAGRCSFAAQARCRRSMPALHPGGSRVMRTFSTVSCRQLLRMVICATAAYFPQEKSTKMSNPCVACGVLRMPFR